MYQFDFNFKEHGKEAPKVHFTGIGGISMSGLAEILLSKGVTVSGSDNKESAVTKHLESLGARVFIGQDEKNIASDTDVLVYTAAVKADNPELLAADRLSIPKLTRAQFLGELMKEYKTAIAVSGTHGKTTTTSMISEILLEDQADPTILVGGMLNRIGGNLRVGQSSTMITEACEYTNSFLSFFPTHGIILNIKEDHLDFFKDIDDIRHSFKVFANLLPEHGCLVINGSIENLSYIIEDCKCKVLTYGLNSTDYDYSAHHISYDERACGSFDLYHKEEKLANIELHVPGEHNVSNALAAIATCLDLGISLDHIQAGFSAYTGTDRRFQVRGSFQGVTVVDDYAHHPDEIQATLHAAKQYPHKKLWVVFQPHTYTRTKALFDGFVQSLSKADAVVLADIYAARETDTLGVSSAQIADAIKKLGVESYHFATFEEIENFFKKNCSEGDLLITMGAGDVVNIANDLTK